MEPRQRCISGDIGRTATILSSLPNRPMQGLSWRTVYYGKPHVWSLSNQILKCFYSYESKVSMWDCGRGNWIQLGSIKNNYRKLNWIKNVQKKHLIKQSIKVLSILILLLTHATSQHMHEGICLLIAMWNSKRYLILT